MYTQATISQNHESILDHRHFDRRPGTGLTRDNLSEFAVDQNGRKFCVDLIIGFLTNITHYLSSAQYALEYWQPQQVANAADTIWSECVTLGGDRAADWAHELLENVDAGRPRQARHAFTKLRTELIFVWEDLQDRLEALRLDMAKNEEVLKDAGSSNSWGCDSSSAV